MTALLSLRSLTLAVLAIAALAASASASVAGEPTTLTPGSSCYWDGTAPACKGKCAADEITPQSASDADDARYPGFGASCITGVKTYCCKLRCPGGYVLSGNECVELQDGGVPVGTQIITLPKSPVEGTKREKGPIEAPKRLEGTKLEKGPIATSEPAPPVPPPAPTPQPKPVTVRLPVDVYDDPGDKKQKIGVLQKDTQGVFLVEPLRGDNWYNVKGNVPKGIGWVWSGPGYESIKF